MLAVDLVPGQWYDITKQYSIYIQEGERSIFFLYLFVSQQGFDDPVSFTKYVGNGQ